MALVAMAFLAVLREGFETSVFLLAAFQDATDTDRRRRRRGARPHRRDRDRLGIYRGGVRINLTRFFRITGLVLVLVAAGLLATAAPHRPRGGLDQRPPGPGASTSPGWSSRARSPARC